ncbi:hypothetical protein [Nitrosopumilus sp.]|uniref:hypothetical protein n=1 Tax=Nitrosopumilus sp. TaxID=2024843 RepID=UPI00292E62A5|nr:hypothetical protein [Nitrosopumilus sp.]
MERSVTHHNDNDKSVNDDLSPEEVADIKEFYSDKTERKKFGTVEELIKDLNS